MVHNLLKKLVENATNDEKERLLNSASYFDLRGMLSLTNLAQEASSLPVVHTTDTAGSLAYSALRLYQLDSDIIANRLRLAAPFCTE